MGDKNYKLSDKKVRKAILKSRHGKKRILRLRNKDEWRLYLRSVGHYFRYGMSDMPRPAIEFFDPEGGPFLEIGSHFVDTTGQEWGIAKITMDKLYVYFICVKDGSK